MVIHGQFFTKIRDSNIFPHNVGQKRKISDQETDSMDKNGDQMLLDHNPNSSVLPQSWDFKDEDIVDGN